MQRGPMEMALSTDIVMENALSHLKSKDLLTCRRVSKFWNKAASSVLRKRSKMVKNIYEEDQLMELEECIQQSWDFPFAGLTFDQPWRLSSAGAMNFFKNYGARFTRLRLNTSWTIRLQELAPFINHLPRLSILEVGWPSGRPPLVEVLDPADSKEDGKNLKLSSVQTIRIRSESPEVNEDVLRQVLMAASPSLRVECTEATTYEIFRALKSAGKLQAVSVMKVGEDEHGKDDAFRVSKLLSAESLTLTKLEFSGGCLDELKKILFSCQQTLKNLRLFRICPSEFSSECPVLAKLTTLSLVIVDQSCEYVFQGRHGNKFPALKKLELDVTYEDHNASVVKFADSLFIVPSLGRIDLDGYFDKARIEDLARSFPNVVEIRLYHHCYDSGWPTDSDPMDIWSVGAFQFLEKLRIWHYTIQPPTKNYGNMDRFLTGIPNSICRNLRKHTWQNLVDSPFNEILRDSPNLLQLKNLKELTICVTPHFELKELPEEPPFISMVSVWYALRMMPNLKAKFVCDYNSLSGRFEEEKRDKAVTMLKTAFKLVQPYVELEPYFF